MIVVDGVAPRSRSRNSGATLFAIAMLVGCQPAPERIATPLPAYVAHPEVSSSPAAPSEQKNDDQIATKTVPPGPFFPLAQSLLANGKIREALVVAHHGRSLGDTSSDMILLTIDAAVGLELWEDVLQYWNELQGVSISAAEFANRTYHLEAVSRLARANTQAELKAFLATSPPKRLEQIAKKRHDELILSKASSTEQLSAASQEMLTSEGRSIASQRLGTLRDFQWQQFLTTSKMDCSYEYQNYSYDARLETVTTGHSTTTRFIPARRESSCVAITVSTTIKNRHSDTIFVTVPRRSVLSSDDMKLALESGQARTISFKWSCAIECDAFRPFVTGGKNMP